MRVAEGHGRDNGCEPGPNAMGILGTTTDYLSRRQINHISKN